MKTIGSRLSHVIELKNTNPNKISVGTDIHASTVKNYILDKGKPDNLKLDKIADFLGVQRDWLKSGTGNMELSDYDQNETINHFSETELDYKKNQKKETKGVPYYDVEFTAGFLEVENNNSIMPDSYVSHPFFKGCDYVVRASGQSMAKVICHGDAIGLVKINNWKEFFPFGEIYAIVTNDGFRMVKVITKGDTDDYYTLISKPTDNKKDEFPNQQIKKSSIMSIFKVQASSHLY